MPSSWTASLRFEQQFTGENINLWGDKLNVVLSHADYSIAGWLTKPLTGNVSLSTANASDDEARAAMLKFTGSGPFTVTIPSVSKNYAVWNACTAALTITTGAGAAAVLKPGERVSLMCDGSDVIRVQASDFAGQRITGVADPSDPQDAATKQYADSLAFTANAGILPGQTGSAGKVLTTDGTTAFWALPIADQTGNAGKFLTTDGTNSAWTLPIPAQAGNAGKFLTTNGTSSSWRTLTISDVSDYAADQAAKTNSATALAVAFAIAL